MALTADQIIEKFGRLPIQQKAAAAFVLSGLLWAGFYFLFYLEKADEVEKLGRQIKTLNEEKATYEDKKQKYLALRAEVKRLEQEQKELIRILPTEDEVSSFIQGIHSQAELAGLNIQLFDIQAEEKQDFYARIPVRMEIAGTYHQIMKFVYSVGNLKRIVNIQDLMLDSGSGATDANKQIILTAKFVASTFRFIEKPISG